MTGVVSPLTPSNGSFSTLKDLTCSMGNPEGTQGTFDLWLAKVMVQPSHTWDLLLKGVSPFPPLLSSRLSLVLTRPVGVLLFYRWGN